DDRGADRDSRGHDGPQTPDRGLPLDATAAVLALEEPTTVVLLVAVLRQPQGLVVRRVDDDTVSGQTGRGLDLRHRPEQRVGVVLGVLRRLRLHTRPLEQALDVRARTGTGEQLGLLDEGQQVQSPLVDLRHPEVGVLDHLVGELEEPGDLLERVGLLRRVGDVELRLGAALGDGGQRALDRTLDEVGDGVAVRAERALPEQVGHNRATERPDDGPVVRGQPRRQGRRGRLRVVVPLRPPLRGRDGGAAVCLHTLQALVADVLDEVLAEGRGLGVGVAGLLARVTERPELGHDRVSLVGRLDLRVQLVGLRQVGVDLLLLLRGEAPTLRLDPLRDLTGGLEGGLTLLLEVHPQFLSCMEMTARYASTGEVAGGSSDGTDDLPAGASSLAWSLAAGGSLACCSWSLPPGRVDLPSSASDSDARTESMASRASRSASSALVGSRRPAFTCRARPVMADFTASSSVSWFAPIGVGPTSYSRSFRSS